MGVGGDGEAGVQLGPGVQGEIVFRGPNVFRGYWGDDEATSEVLVDGWLRSGDIGRFDEEGFIYVEDRAKDVVIRGGENVYSAEVEAAAYEHPGVHEAAVFGVAHERLGEEVAIVVLPHGGAELDADDLLGFMGDKLAGFKVPTLVRWAAGPLPRNAAGKVLKAALRSDLEAELGRSGGGGGRTAAGG